MLPVNSVRVLQHESLPLEDVYQCPVETLQILFTVKAKMNAGDCRTPYYHNNSNVIKLRTYTMCLRAVIHQDVKAMPLR